MNFFKNYMGRRANRKADKFGAQTREQQTQARIERQMANRFQKAGFTDIANEMFDSSRISTQKAIKSQGRFKKAEAKSPERQNMKKNHSKIYGKGY